MIKIIYNALCIRKYNLYFLKLLNLFLNNYTVIESYKQTHTHTQSEPFYGQIMELPGHA